MIVGTAVAGVTAICSMVRVGVKSPFQKKHDKEESSQEECQEGGDRAV